MKTRNMSIYIAIALVALFVFSCFVDIKPQITVGLSLATLFFTIAQMLDSQVGFWNEDLQNQVDIFNNVGDLNFSPQDVMLIKAMIKYQIPPKKQKNMHVLATILYSAAFIVLFLAFVFPFEINEKIGTSTTILSAALLFFSIWTMDKQQERKAQWDEVQMIAIMNKNSTTSKEINEADNGNNQPN